MLIDTHCHLSFKAFNETWPDVVKRAQDKDIQMICVGAAKGTSEKAVAIAESSDGVFAAIGLHPTHTDEVFDYEWFSRNADNPKVVALGETGIDHYHVDEAKRPVTLKKQEDLLRQHLTIAQEKKMPVILHSRDLPSPRLRQASGSSEQRETSYEHLLRIVKEFGYFNCVLHCFGGNWDVAKKFLDAGLMISFTGIVTFKNASESLKEVVRNIPLDRFMIETDSPYLTPEPHRSKENEPSFVEYVAQGIAEIRGVSYDVIAEVTTENAKRFFKLP